MDHDESLRSIRRAAIEFARAEAQLREAVFTGRGKGLSWDAIARETGLNRETLRRNFNLTRD